MVVVGESGSGRVGVIVTESGIIDAVEAMRIRIVIRTVVRIDIVLGLLCRLSVAIVHIGVGEMIGIETTVVMTVTEGTGIAGIAETEMTEIGTIVIRADAGTVTRDRIVGIRTIVVHRRLPVDQTLIDSAHQKATATTGDPVTSIVVLETRTVETANPTAQAVITATAPKPKT